MSARVVATITVSLTPVVPRASAQLTMPLSVRTAPAPSDSSRRVRALGGLTSCHAFDCDQAASLGVELSPVSSWRVSADATAGRNVLTSGRSTSSDRRLDLVYARGGASAWFGFGAADERADERAPDAGPSSRSAWLEYGSMLRWRAVAVAVSLGSGTSVSRTGPTHYVKTTVFLQLDSLANLWRPDTMRQTVTDSGSVARTPWTSAQLRLGWAGERWTASAVAGGLSSRAHGPIVWGGLETSRRLGRYVAFLASAGTLPPRLAGDAAPHRGAVSVGLTAATSWLSSRPGTAPAVDASADFATQPLGGERYRVTVRVPDATRVELASDCTAWQPIPMQRLGGERWVVDLPATPGAHQVSIRANGGPWQAPAGLTAVDDDFGGSAGAFVIPP